MITKTKIMESLIGKPMVNAMVKMLYHQSDDFPELHQNYLAAIKQLNTLLGPEANHSIQKYMVAIDQMCASNLYHAGVHGLKMNYDHFLNPMMPNCTWPQVDFDDYLRPHAAEALPLYKAAYQYKSVFEAQLPAEQKDILDAVIGYEAAMECSGMKLAHYYGYLLGNELLRHCIPGYHADTVLDIRYAHLMENYFGRRLNTDLWEGRISATDLTAEAVPEEDFLDTLLLREELMKQATT